MRNVILLSSELTLGEKNAKTQSRIIIIFLGMMAIISVTVVTCAHLPLLYWHSLSKNRLRLDACLNFAMNSIINVLQMNLKKDFLP